ncbi:MAG TPA: beta-ketoacyl-[acyl-carrier-protein] synthase family protein [Candidatus Hydrogenedentes bacterium]|nr:beta-ketoacyl-[acyl-carrier-protein] synthase family protein [Candidatus Hydrogenedentota bacterium]HOS03261.1 beta-ketoacyl-[acyl-carrier-protein] synthase family protein [Candidatus Hydrogenedentota bacterium]
MNSPPCVITAASAVTSLGADVEAAWSGMMRNIRGIRPMQRLPRGRYRSDVAGEIPAELEAALEAPPGARVRRLALHAARQALRQAPGSRDRTGLVLATTKADIDGLGAALRGEIAQWPAHYDPAALAIDLAQALGLEGPVLAVSNACASGLVAVAQAARLLRRNDAERMLVVGVDVLHEFVLGGFSSLAALSPDPCRPFDANRTGLSLGEGAGAIALCREGSLAGTGLGVVRGWAVTNDAHHLTGPSPTGEGLQRALRGALAMAGMAPEAIDYINAHGTGTAYNDAMEMKAVAAVFGENAPPMTSMKGYFGHTLGACGVIELALCLKAMEQRTIPASMGLDSLDPGSALRIPAEHMPVPRLDAIISMKSGFGGVNAAVALTGMEAA